MAEAHAISEKDFIVKTAIRSLLRRLLGKKQPLDLGMTTPQERDFCFRFTSEVWDGQGVIVDLGCWLGATTRALARGLPTKNRVIHAYDQFRWSVYMDRYVEGTELEGRFRPGDSFLDEVRQRFAPWQNQIEIHAGNLTEQSPPDEAIAFLLVDVIKSAELAEHVVRHFFSRLRVGALVMQQDFSHFYTGWIQLIHSRFRDHFTPVEDIPESCSLVFRLEKAIPEESLQNCEWLRHPSNEEIADAFDLARSWVADSKRGSLDAAEVMLHAHQGNLKQARARLEQFDKRSDELDHVASILESWDIPHGEAGIKKVGARAYVGGLWEEMGRLQFDFLRSQGLKPFHTLLDIGCGCLRGGRHFIAWLDCGRYLGIDKESTLLEAGKEELGATLIQEKAPRLLVSSDFDFARFETEIDIALSQSLFTHLPPDLIRLCLRNLRNCISPEGAFFATFFEEATPRQNPSTPHDHGYFGYTREEMLAFGEETGWRGEYHGDWGHPRDQRMIVYRPAVRNEK